MNSLYALSLLFQWTGRNAHDVFEEIHANTLLSLIGLSIQLGSHDRANASTGVPSIPPSIAKATCIISMISQQFGTSLLTPFRFTKLLRGVIVSPFEAISQAGRLQGLADATYSRVATATFLGYDDLHGRQ